MAGCEAANQIASRGIAVNLYEMKPLKYSPAHKHDGFAELVCSNSLKADRLCSAAGLLKAEMRILGSISLECAEQCTVPAGGALAVDRDRFSALVTEKIRSNPNINVITKEVETIGDTEGSPVIIATGPLTSDRFSAEIERLCGREHLSFYDAASPIVTADSIDYDKAFFAARYDRGTADYINCPMQKDEYERFYDALVSAESAQLHEFDRPPSYYEGCMPVEVMAKRGVDTLRFGPLKPVGLSKGQERFYAVVQLRRENISGTLYNLVGFQTNLKFAEQKRVLGMIPGLEKAEFVRYGVMHRNTFIDSPRVLDIHMNLRSTDIYFAGQITGVEGYMESAASGIYAGINAAKRALCRPPITLPSDTMIGALMGYVSDSGIPVFQPMGGNMGIIGSKVRIKNKQERYQAIAEQAIESLNKIMNEVTE